MYVTDRDKIRDVKLAKIATSDHIPRYLWQHSRENTIHSHTTFKYRSYNGNDIDNFLADLEAVPLKVMTGECYCTVNNYIVNEGIGLILVIQTFYQSTLSVLYKKDVFPTSSIV